MKRFAQLFTELDQTTKTLKKVDALVRYFEEAPDEDKLWAIALLSEKRPKRAVRSSLVREWGAQAAGIPEWLFLESYSVVGDLGETIALMAPGQETEDSGSLAYWVDYIRSMEKLDDAVKHERVTSAWANLGMMERFVFNKLIGGSFRVGLSQKLMVRALSIYTNTDENKLAHRLMGNWSPDSTTYQKLIVEEDLNEDASHPYPFFLAYALEQEPETLGEPSEWFAEHKWDGIRGQVIVRKGQVFTWSRGEELVTDKFPEYLTLKDAVPDGTVIDGEILPFKDGKALPFQILQTRIGRKNVTKKILADAPVILLAYDILEYQGEDIREMPMAERRKILEQVVHSASSKTDRLLISELVQFSSWEALAKERMRSRELLSEGIMLKRKDSPYRVGRRKGDWWKWKVDALTIDAVLIYAMRGSGRRANLYTDYTFAVWDNGQLIPFTKAYSGLTDEEIRQMDRWIKNNTIEKFGPVRSVHPVQVFEIAFEGIQASTRHKSGIALRFPRINRWRQDKPASEADTLQTLREILRGYSG